MQFNLDIKKYNNNNNNNKNKNKITSNCANINVMKFMLYEIILFFYINW